jgi:hypothetical protein
MPYDEEEMAALMYYGQDEDLDEDELGWDEDEYGEDEDDEFGMTERRAQRLLKRRARLVSLLPVVRPRRRARLQRRIERINRKLARGGYTAQMQAAADIMAASGVQGIGGLQFQAQSPPGIGRLVRLPFYPVQANPGQDATSGTLTAGGFGVASLTNPVFVDIPTPTGVGTTAGAHLLRTPQISWATLRIVGFESQQRKFQGIAQTGPVMLVSDLQIGGGANLFTHEDFADATIYDADQPEFVGLRDYPILRSPNTAEVQVQLVGNQAFSSVTFAAALLCEVLVDDNYGAHIPGPYSRKGALVRQGGSFVG